MNEANTNKVAKESPVKRPGSTPGNSIGGHTGQKKSVKGKKET